MVVGSSPAKSIPVSLLQATICFALPCFFRIIIVATFRLLLPSAIVSGTARREVGERESNLSSSLISLDDERTLAEELKVPRGLNFDPVPAQLFRKCVRHDIVAMDPLTQTPLDTVCNTCTVPQYVYI